MPLMLKTFETMIGMRGKMDVNSKRITFLISSLSGGGAKGVCVKIANGLAEQGWQVDLVVLHLNNVAYHDRIIMWL